MQRPVFVRMTVAVLLAAAALIGPGTPGAVAKSGIGGTVSATNGVYIVYVQDQHGSGVGLYTIQTGPSHPAGSGLNVLFGNGAPGTSFETIRSYTTHTDYITGVYLPASDPGFTEVALDPYGTVTLLGTTGLRTTYVVPGPAVTGGGGTPDALTITEDVVIHGTTASDSSVSIQTTVANTGTSSVALGIRYLWDYQIGVDDGPTFQAINPNGPVLTHEAQFAPPNFEAYQIVDNDGNPRPPTFAVIGTANGPISTVPQPTPPDVLQYTCWPTDYATAFDYTINASNDVATGAGPCSDDSAGNYYWGVDQAHAFTVALAASHSVSASLIATVPPPSSPDTTPPTCKLTSTTTGPPKQVHIAVQDSDGGLADITVTRSTNAVVTVPPFAIGDTNPVSVTGTKVNQTLSSIVGLRATDRAGNSTTCDPVMTDAIRSPGKPVLQTVDGVTIQDHVVTVFNGTPGLQTLLVRVNRRTFVLPALKDDERATIDIATALKEGTNSVTLIVLGRPGATATILFGNI
jgi:hypothetical protein